VVEVRCDLCSLTLSYYFRKNNWHPPWGPTTPLQLPLLSIGEFVPVHPISPTSLQSRGQSKFKYSYLPPPSKASFKDKTVTELQRSKADNTSGTWWLFLTMVVEQTWAKSGIVLLFHCIFPYLHCLYLFINQFYHLLYCVFRFLKK